MGNVVYYKTGEQIDIPDGAPNQGIVTLLESVLVRARRGEISSVVIAYADTEGHASGGWDGSASLILLAVSRLVRRLHKHLDDVEDSHERSS